MPLGRLEPSDTAASPPYPGIEGVRSLGKTATGKRNFIFGSCVRYIFNEQTKPAKAGGGAEGGGSQTWETEGHQEMPPAEGNLLCGLGA